MSTLKPPPAPLLFTPQKPIFSTPFGEEAPRRLTDEGANAAYADDMAQFEKQKSMYGGSDFVSPGGRSDIVYMVPKASQSSTPVIPQAPQVVYMQAPAQIQYSTPSAPPPPPKAPDPRRTATGRYVQDPVAGSTTAPKLYGTGGRAKTMLTDPSGSGMGSGDMLLKKALGS